LPGHSQIQILFQTLHNFDFSISAFCLAVNVVGCNPGHHAPRLVTARTALNKMKEMQSLVTWTYLDHFANLEAKQLLILLVLGHEEVCFSISNWNS